MRKNPQAGEIYRHFKGNLYRIITLAVHSETGETMVVYQALYGDYGAYVRELSMFMSKTDKEKYPQVQQQYRFEKIPQVGEVCPETVSCAQEKAEREKISFVQEKAESEKVSSSQEKMAREEAGSSQEKQDTEEEKTLTLDPGLLEFLDAGSCRERLNLLAAMHPHITDEMINTMAVALDVEIQEGDIEERYAGLRNCLLMIEKYECSRLR